ncbi:MAG: glycosyltransferase family 39 protein [Verrucomicrobiota bacterium]
MRNKSGDVAVLIYLATATVVIHLLVGGRYGFHRDELATLDDARHLAWGYVAYPPVTPFFGRVSLQIFGTSLTGFRFFAALACALSVLLTGLMARELGGRRGAQLIAASAAVPFALAAGSLMQYVSFDYLAWVATAYFIVRLCKSNDPRWWVAIGGTIGFGMLTKYSILVCAAGIIAGVLLTDLRQHLKSKWLWIGVALSVLIFLPNFLWQLRHDFVSLEFLRHIHERDVRIGRTKDFLPDQLLLNLLALPLAFAGLHFYFSAQAGHRFRALGWMFVVSFTIFLIAKGRGYYLAPAYPMLYAAGAVWGEDLLGKWRRGRANVLRATAWSALAIDMIIVIAFVLPLAPINSRWWDATVKINGDLREEIGWPELVETIAGIRDSLPPEERTRVSILAGNYGEAGAINLYGARFGLPQAISGINSYWARGYGNPPPETLIVVGLSRKFLEDTFASCELAGHITNRYGVANEESHDHQEIFLCRDLRESWPAFWQKFRRYG